MLDMDYCTMQGTYIGMLQKKVAYIYVPYSYIRVQNSDCIGGNLNGKTTRHLHFSLKWASMTYAEALTNRISIQNKAMFSG